MIKVMNELRVFEIEGKKTEFVDGPKVVVQSHWNVEGLVIVQFNGASVTVSGKDLIEAVRNSMNTSRFA